MDAWGNSRTRAAEKPEVMDYQFTSWITKKWAQHWQKDLATRGVKSEVRKKTHGVNGQLLCPDSSSTFAVFMDYKDKTAIELREEGWLIV